MIYKATHFEHMKGFHHKKLMTFRYLTHFEQSNQTIDKQIKKFVHLSSWIDLIPAAQNASRELISPAFLLSAVVSTAAAIFGRRTNASTIFFTFFTESPGLQHHHVELESHNKPPPERARSGDLRPSFAVEEEDDLLRIGCQNPLLRIGNYNYIYFWFN